MRGDKPVNEALLVSNVLLWCLVIALAIIVVPVVVRTTDDMLQLVPNSLREGSYALGASRMQTIFRVIVPAAGGSSPASARRRVVLPHPLGPNSVLSLP